MRMSRCRPNYIVVIQGFINNCDVGAFVQARGLTPPVVSATTPSCWVEYVEVKKYLF
jgi:hypothetical protein